MNANFQLNPEHRSITAICVVEDVSKCPLGYTPIVRTHDLDADADMWKDGFFGRRITRYVCVSKSQGKPDHVINSLLILYDKDAVPEGYSIIQQTADTSQKAFQKKQLCFKLGHHRSNMESIVEIIILSKLRTPPDGFEHVGDVNGMHLCARKISALTRLNSPSLGYAISPLAGSTGNIYPNMQQSFRDLTSPGSSGANSYPNSAPNSPSQLYSPGSYQGYAPHHPPLKHSNTLNQLSDVEGIPFVLHEALQTATRRSGSSSRLTPAFVCKTQNEIDMEYSYDFRTERDILITNGC